MDRTLERDKKWHWRYYDLAGEISKWSKDPSTKVGSVIVGNQGQVLSQGYNGFPRGLDDSEDLYNNREVKYDRTVHAEMNAIYNATRSGASLDNSTMYVYGLPICHECAKGIIQVGIRNVVMEYREVSKKWAHSCELAEQFFDDCGVVRTYL